MKNIVITDKDIPLELFKESVIVNLNNIKYSACTGDYTCLKKRSPCRYQDDISVINQWIGETLKASKREANLKIRFPIA